MVATILASSVLVVCEAAATAPRTKEAYLDEEMDELHVREQKDGSTQEDLDTFFKDQSHLQGGPQTQPTETGIFGLPFVPSSLPFMSQLSDLVSVTSFFMLPSVDAYSFGQMVANVPMEAVNQFMSMMHMRDLYLEYLTNHTIAEVVNNTSDASTTPNNS